MKAAAVLVLFKIMTYSYCCRTSNPARIINTSTGCRINLNRQPPNAPLLLTPHTNNTVLPDKDYTIKLSQNEEIEMHCPGSRGIYTDGFNKNESITAKCIGGYEFKIAGRFVHGKSIEDAICYSKINTVAQYSQRGCGGKGREIEVGFKIKDGRFLRQYTTCFDEEKKNVIYSHYILKRQVKGRILGKSRVVWLEGNFYNLGVRVEKIYPIAEQRIVINKQLGLSAGDTKYIKNKSSSNYYFLSKGHLTARVDLIYNAQQVSTFQYVNAAPQWLTFNAGNWQYFERNVRAYAAEHSVDLQVYTGTYGITTLPHGITGEEMELYLYVDENNNKALPVPELFWKIVYDPMNKSGVVVLGVNNPYQTDINRSIICNDVAEKLSWLTFDRFKIKDGYIYACTIEEFGNVFPQIPQFDVQTLLD